MCLVSVLPLLLFRTNRTLFSRAIHVALSTRLALTTKVSLQARKDEIELNALVTGFSWSRRILVDFCFVQREADTRHFVCSQPIKWSLYVDALGTVHWNPSPRTTHSTVLYRDKVPLALVASYGQIRPLLRWPSILPIQETLYSNVR
jgi:hypothetical protein